jgi:hypothetical protein
LLFSTAKSTGAICLKLLHNISAVGIWVPFYCHHWIHCC